MRFIKEHRGLIITLIIFISLVLIAVSITRDLQLQNNSRQIEQLRQKVTKAAMLCYAVEGFYPPDISYLTEQYHLKWNLEEYIVVYDCFASNILPTVQVLVKGAELQ